MAAAKKAKAAYDEAGKAAEAAHQASTKALAGVGGDAKKKAAADKVCPIASVDEASFSLLRIEPSSSFLCDVAARRED